MSTRGYGGTRFNITFNDGKKIETTNLIHLGVVPRDYREKFGEPNATIEEHATYRQP